MSQGTVELYRGELEKLTTRVKKLPSTEVKAKIETIADNVRADLIYAEEYLRKNGNSRREGENYKGIIDRVEAGLSKISDLIKAVLSEMEK